MVKTKKESREGLLKHPLPYFLNKKIRHLIMRTTNLFPREVKKEQINLPKEQIKKILLARANFRIGNAILAIPAINIFRKNFPHATIDFVGSPASGLLYKHLPIDHHYSITRRFPGILWAYFSLVSKIRSMKYDLAVDVSCSQSMTSSFIVGFSGARFRAGSQGKWDRWFNISIPRPAENNKYKVLPVFFHAMRMETQQVFPQLILSSEERDEGKRKVTALIGVNQVPVVGVFVGGRKSKGKKWPAENFLKLITTLRAQGIHVIVFFGPDEKKLMGFFGQSLGKDVPLILEPSLRTFASMVSHCNLFITCDSGPMHLSCALGVRTIALFLKRNFNRWGPPPDIAQIIYNSEGILVEDVLKVADEELCNISLF
ncbi:MAG: lipopolysaccharide heptosyltransferase family protein [Candidatus Brocadia sp. AMX2]|uniref:Lipopolysaccharide heptosyltransferase I n=2 Tax=Candidatus Brocadia TaxID=380240 RepID=A0ABQ0JV59_9BACT|nr:glycosyltransferase family 9 protein [Candidatus Brocadia sinica]KAA0245363.1 MAG: lipopolysaccharide heptosyltransferase family protein [Candidatus Brocadia sp. AMX2]MBC6930926.1 lipopolysaccharide heptosyltransferase family protein [Candidatus Brocadia sp.]MBL1167916.1 lipopolysaccharide heptosyltransferase family protein [Candidatus Brocadia sp. AMX1]NOG41524.1 glycosyltransferase family 9 protein [Planctomycetota bacterium]KXK32818.1 MAG: lipopolysaccharide heptosyltransferase I [Candid